MWSLPGQLVGVSVGLPDVEVARREDGRVDVDHELRLTSVAVQRRHFDGVEPARLEAADGRRGVGETRLRLHVAVRRLRRLLVLESVICGEEGVASLMLALAVFFLNIFRMLGASAKDCSKCQMYVDNFKVLCNILHKVDQIQYALCFHNIENADFVKA